MLPSFISKQEGYGVIVLNPNENYIEVEKPKIHVQSSSDSSDEPAEKRERKDKVSKETKKRRDFYEKYRNPQREKEMMQLYIRVSETTTFLYYFLYLVYILFYIDCFVFLKESINFFIFHHLFPMAVYLD